MVLFHRTRTAMRVVCATVAVFCTSLVAFAADNPVGPIPTSPFKDEIEVRLVLLHATVLNKRGETVRGLAAEDFLVTEDGVPQTISVFGHEENQPLKVAFLLDVSGSMALGGKLEAARQAIHRFVDALRPDDQVALLIFADAAVVVKKGFTTDRALFFDRLDGVEAFGKTALHDALAATPSLLSEAAPGRKAVILLTDGVDNASAITATEALETARKVSVPVYVIGIADRPLGKEGTPPTGPVDPDGGGAEGQTLFDTLSEVADGTGGEMVPAYGPEQILEAARTVEERLRSQYVLGYRPSGRALPGFRAVQVATTSKRYEVQTRKGYVVAIP